MKLHCTKSSAIFFQEVLKLFSDVRLAYGESDEYSFVLHKNTTLYGTLASITLQVHAT